MKNMSKSKLIYGGIAFSFALSLAACAPETEAVSQEDTTGNVELASEKVDEKTAEVEVLEQQDSPNSSTETVTKANAKLPAYLPADFPVPDDVEITMSNSGQDEGKKSVLLIIRTKEDIDTVTSMYTTYLEGRKLEDAAQTLDAKNIIIQGESPTNSEYWSMIGGSLASEEGVVELTINWEEL